MTPTPIDAATDLPGRAGDPLRGAHVVLGVTGSISCYKAVEVASRLVQAGATVDIALTAHATEFVTPLTFRSITAREPYGNMWHPHGEFGEAHAELARRADLLLIAPPTASCLARLAHGLADDMVALTLRVMQAARWTSRFEQRVSRARLHLMRSMRATFTTKL